MTYTFVLATFNVLSMLHCLFHRLSLFALTSARNNYSKVMIYFLAEKESPIKCFLPYPVCLVCVCLFANLH